MTVAVRPGGNVSMMGAAEPGGGCGRRLGAPGWFLVQSLEWCRSLTSWRKRERECVCVCVCIFGNFVWMVEANFDILHKKAGPTCALYVTCVRFLPFSQLKKNLVGCFSWLFHTGHVRQHAKCRFQREDQNFDRNPIHGHSEQLTPHDSAPGLTTGRHGNKNVNNYPQASSCSRDHVTPSTHSSSRHNQSSFSRVCVLSCVFRHTCLQLQFATQDRNRTQAMSMDSIHTHWHKSENSEHKHE